MIVEMLPGFDYTLNVSRGVAPERMGEALGEVLVK
jgi:hypothetical protein